MSPSCPSHMHAVPHPLGGRRRPLKLDIVDAAESFTPQLHDVDRPGVCPKCFFVFAKALWDEPCMPIAVQLLKSHHDFWTACAQLACAPGAEGDLAPLRRTLDANIAACPTKSRHVYAVKALPDSASCLMDALCRCLTAAVSFGSQKKHKNILLSKNGMWPSALEQIMPDGIAAYARWACVLPTHCGLALVSRLTVIARRQVMEDLVQTPSRDRVAATLVRAFRQWRVPITDFPIIRRHLLEPDVALGRPTLEEAAAILWQAICMLTVFEEGPDRRLDDFSDFSFGYERLLHDAIIDTLTKPGFDAVKQKEDLIKAASALQAKSDLPLHPVVAEYRRRPDVQRYVKDGLTFGDMVFMYLRQRRDSRLCSGPGCDKGARDGADGTGVRALSLCSRCKIMRYCGPECQRLDWTNGRCDVPHKVVCSALCKFLQRGILGPDASMPVFTAAYRGMDILTDVETASLTKLALMDDLLHMEFQIGALSLFTNKSRSEVLRGMMDGTLEGPLSKDENN
ncbi:hypothetical protein AURDEDRAFT_173789 [Auricularia subglabra TFB-10046 SS5]|nr:hypothetical protein AURDEDRAFT_173789 [Auricularia subglabra TFB-10046 SS5]